MSHLITKCRKIVSRRMLALLAAVAVNAGMSISVWSQSGRPAQTSRPVDGLVTPSPAELATFKTCLELTPNKDDWKKCGDPIYEACNRDSGSPDTTYVMSMCLMRVNAAWDRKLNQLYNITIAAQTPSARVSLRTAQRLWIASRDADCSAVYEIYLSGSIRSVAAAGCRANATRRRVEWLSGFGEGEP